MKLRKGEDISQTGNHGNANKEPQAGKGGQIQVFIGEKTELEGRVYFRTAGIGADQLTDAHCHQSAGAAVNNTSYRPSNVECANLVLYCMITY